MMVPTGDGKRAHRDIIIYVAHGSGRPPPPLPTPLAATTANATFKRNLPFEVYRHFLKRLRNSLVRQTKRATTG
jgi:hypothetical protein